LFLQVDQNICNNKDKPGSVNRAFFIAFSMMILSVIEQKHWSHERLVVAETRYCKWFGDSFALKQAKRTRYAIT